jgi:putative transcriptional regulator
MRNELRCAVVTVNRQRYAAWKERRDRLRELSGVAPKPPSVIPAIVDVAAIRQGLGGWPAVTQAAFAGRFGFSAAAVRDWEQGRRKPDAAARVLLLVIAHNPAAVDAAIKAASSPTTQTS